MPANIMDVARRAGVSIATVSRVVNGQTVVAPETRERVMEAVRELGYQPNALAASLVRGRSRTLGIVIPDISNPFFPEVVRGLEDAAHKAGYNVILCNSDLNIDKEIEYFEVLRQKQVDGLIYHSGTVTSRHLEVFERLNLPVVLAATHDDGYHFPCVLVDNRRAAEEAMDHLIDLGHRRLGVITGNDPISGKTRLAGYRDALNKHGLKLPEEWTAVLDWRFESAYAAAQRMFDGKRRPTAVAVASDYMALGVVAAAIDIGLQVPRDVSVIGFDNIRLAAEVRPALTTVAQPMYEMGAEAASLLIRCITEGVPEGDQATVILPNRLVVRSSSAPPAEHT